MPGNPQEELRLELGEAQKALLAVRDGGLDALVIDADRGEELFRGAARAMRELRLELDEARETLHTIRAGGFDALVINAGHGEEVFALGGTGRPDRLLVGGIAEGGKAIPGGGPRLRRHPGRWPGRAGYAGRAQPRRGPGGSG